MRANYKMQRLYIEVVLSQDAVLPLLREQAHYLLNVLRMKEGDTLLVFNGRDGEWQAKLVEVSKKTASLQCLQLERTQPKPLDLIYCFAPLKHARLDYMVQKAVEMGVSVLQPVLTQYTQVTRLNLERINANAIEAAEQCGVLALPIGADAMPLKQLLEGWDATRPLIFCDEAADDHNPLLTLEKLEKGKIGLLIGPEGGFSDEERKLLMAQPFVTVIALGPRILRADTAAVAALALICSTLGDW